jgi:S1-C subfamily serine protease
MMRVSSGPVQKAGLRAGDVITKITGPPIAAENDVRVALLEIGPGITWRFRTRDPGPRTLDHGLATSDSSVSRR